MNVPSPRVAFLPLVLGTALLAQAPPPVRAAVEDVLPASTYAAVRFGGLAACAEAAGELPMADVVERFLQRVPAEVRARTVERGLEQGALHVQHSLQHAGLSPADLRAVLRRPMVLAMGRMSIEGMGPSVALVIDSGDAAPAVQRCLAAVETLLQQHLPGVSATEARIGDVSVRQLQVPHGPPVFAGSVGSCFVVTNSRGYLQDVVAVANGSKPGLMRSTRLASLRQRLPEAALASVFVNTASLHTMFEPHLPYEAASLADALGAGRVDALYAGTTATPHGGADVFHLGVGGDEHGLLKALVSKPVDLGFASVCSPNTVLFAAGSFDAAGVVDAFDRFFALLPGYAQGVRADVGRGLGRALRRAGISTETVRAFGDQVGVAVSLEKGAMPKPELLLRVAVRDVDTVVPLLQRLEAATSERGLEWRTRKVGAHGIRFCNVVPPGSDLQLSPSYVLADGALLCASDVGALMRALRQGEAKEESLAAQPDFAALRDRAEGASGVLHARLFRAVELGWRPVETLLYPMLDSKKDVVGFGSDALPDAETMAKALGTHTWLYAVDGDGVTVSSQGTLALGSLLAAFGAVGDDVLGRACGKVY